MGTFRQQHLAMLLAYSGISFISGAVNHGFFSGERSLWTAAIGIVMFVSGAWLDHRLKGGPPQGVARTLLWGTLLSIGLGFFTGGLQHFPDSPARSAWVVPLGFAISALALWFHGTFTGTRAARSSLAYAGAVGVLVTAGSLGAWQWLERNPGLVQAHSHGHGDGDGGAALVAQVVTRTIQVDMKEMRFEPAVVQVQPGETVRFVARNAGQLEHELVIGTETEIREHAAAMREGRPHSHGGGAAITVRPGHAGDLVVTFARPGTLAMACLLPGHLEAGMSGKLEVAALSGTPPERGAGTPARPAPGGHDHSTHKH